MRPGNLQSAHVETAPADSTSLTITACFDEPDNPGPRRPGKESIVSIPVNTLFNGDPASSRITLDIGGITLMLTSAAATDAATRPDAMAAMAGVDCLWVGHFDLSSSLGIPGEFGHKKFKSAIDKVAAATRKHGKALGRLVPNVETGIEVNKLGFDFICYSGDVWLLQSALSTGIEQLRKSCVAKK